IESHRTGPTTPPPQTNQNQSECSKKSQKKQPCLSPTHEKLRAITIPPSTAVGRKSPHEAD
ncbi:MAG: hypothetical protein LUB83_06125, partial [Prevotellaceae bacterium]|nr:hypothetical protein [Prevotellaceae bacterium]